MTEKSLQALEAKLNKAAADYEEVRSEFDRNRRQHNPIQSRSAGSPTKTRNSDLMPAGANLATTHTNTQLQWTGREIHVEEVFDCFHHCFKILQKTYRGTRNAEADEFFDSYVRKLAEAIEKTVKREDFDIVKLIGEGNHAQVFLAKYKPTGQPCVIKKMEKEDVCSRRDAVCVMDELDFMVRCAQEDVKAGRLERREGLCNIIFAFQSESSLYLVTEFYPGGDLLSLLSKYESFSEEWTRFYMAELIVAIGKVHALGYVHRDVKIENILIDARGHTHLADFGSVARLTKEGKVEEGLSGGTPDYMAPEFVALTEGQIDEHTESCDWWSAGVVMYEMLYGETPFFAEEGVLEIYRRIKNYREYLVFPEDGPQLSVDAKDLIMQLMSPAEERLGHLGGVKEIMNHSFFEGFDWSKLSERRAPFKPELTSAFDTAFFDDFEEEEEEDTNGIQSYLRSTNTNGTQTSSVSPAQDLQFAGYFYVYRPPKLASLSNVNLGTSLDAPSVPATPIQVENKKAAKEDLQKVLIAKSRGRANTLTEQDRQALLAESTKDLQQGPGDSPSTDTETTTEGSLTAANDVLSPSKKTSSGRRVIIADFYIFMDSVKNNDLPRVRTMLSAKSVDVNCCNPHGQTPLAIAASLGYLPMVKYLVSQEADVNVQDSAGYTALHFAMLEEHLEIIELLLRSGADATLENEDEETALDMTDDPEFVAAIKEKISALTL
eukprot:Clim_evm57s119 gene=Clim_evmTU57s119